MNQIRFCIPVIISILFIVISEAGYPILLLPILLVANGLNILWGEFSNEEMLKVIRKFHSHPATKAIKRFSAVFFIGMFVWAINYLSRETPSLGALLLFGFLYGVLAGCFMVTLAHELFHSCKNADKLLASLLLIINGIPHLAADHLLGHHRFIGLEKDAGTAQKGQSFYGFFFKSSLHRVQNSISPPSDLPAYLRLKMRKHNCILLAATLAIAVFIFLLPAGRFLWLFFIAQAFTAYVLYEVVNYIQHYGLSRADHESIGLEHSWNCYYKYTNYFLFMLPLHSVHHLPANRRKEVANRLTSAPRMPYVYFMMIFLALIPALWFKTINPKLKNAKAGN